MHQAKQEFLKSHPGILQRTAERTRKSPGVVSRIFWERDRSQVIEQALTEAGAPGFPREEPRWRRPKKQEEL